MTGQPPARAPADPPATPAPALPGERLLLWLTLGLLAVVLIPCLVSVAKNPYWDLDPRVSIATEPLAALTPAQFAWLQWAGLTLALAGLVAHLAYGGRASWASMAVTLGGALAARALMSSHADTLTRCGSWVASAAMALSAAHLAQRPVLRRWMIAALAAVAVPMALRAALYVLVEHPALVDWYRQNRAQILAARGWEDGSPQHLLYERRLMFADATGAFALSNVFGSIMAALGALAAALTASLLSRRLYRLACVPGGAAVLALLAVGLSRSRGAAATLVLVVGVCGAIWWLRRWPGLTRWAVPAMGPALLALAVAAVVVRGQMGLPAPPPPIASTQSAASPATAVQPPAGERSLLFRYQYWLASARIVAAGWPVRALQGVGPGRFQDLYEQYKEPTNPESVTSAHNVFVDWLVMLGAGGLAWTALVIWWLWLGGRAAAHRVVWAEELAASAPSPGLDVPPGDLLRAFALAAVVFGAHAWVQGAALFTVESLLVWAAGLIGFLAVLALLSREGWQEGPWVRIGLWAAGLVLLVHGQIEVTFHHEAAGTVAWLVLGVMAGSALEGRCWDGLRQWDPLRWKGLAFVLCWVVVLGVRGPWTLTKQEGWLRVAAQQLRDGDRLRAVGALHAAIKVLPKDPRPYADQALILAEQAHVHANAGQTDQARGAAALALAMLQRFNRQRAGGLMLLRLEARLLDEFADALGPPDGLNVAADTWRGVVARAPSDIASHRSLGDALVRAGRPDQAMRAYARCLELNRLAYLDPLVQLPAAEVSRIEAALRQCATQKAPVSAGSQVAPTPRSSR